MDDFDPDAYLAGGSFDPDAYLKNKASIGTAIKSSFANMGTTADTAGSLIAGGLSSLVGATDTADSIYKSMEERAASRKLWANPDNEEIGFGGKVAGALATLPMQIAGAGLSSAETGKTLLDAGETLGTAGKGAAIDAAGNVAGMILPGFKQGSMAVRGATGFGANAAQDYATKAAIQSMANTEAGKRAFEPTLEDAAVSGMLGGTAAVVGGKNKPQAKSKIVERLMADEAPVAPKIPDVVPEVPLVGPRTGRELSKAAYEQAVRERELQRQSAFNRPEQFGDMGVDTPMGRMARDLGAEPGVAEQPLSRTAQDLMNRPMSAEQMAALDAKERSLADAQASLDLRQKALEDAMAREATLGMNASLRQRQEAASAVSELHKRYTEQLAQLEQGKADVAEGRRLAEESAKAAQRQQMEIDDTQHVLPDTNEVIAPQYGTNRGIGRVDENGMPIRADRSMEAQNLENPLQRNLWGDELPRETSQEAPRGITKAIDMMDNTTQAREGGKFVQGTPQSRAVSLLTGNPSLGTKKAGFDFTKKRGQGGKIDQNLLTYGVAGLIDRLRGNPNTQQPMRKLMGLFRGTFNEASIKEAYNQSLDPSSRMQLYMMSPDQFLTLAKRREPWEVAGQDSTNRRESIKKALETDAGLNDIPYLRVNNKGEITGHEGRHRAEVLASKLDLIPVRMETPYHKNEDGPLPFERLQPQDAWGSPSRYGEPLLTPESRPNHGYTETANTKGTIPFNFKKQGGGLLISPKEKVGLDNAMVPSDDGTLIPANPDVASALAKAHGEKDGNVHTYLQSGSTSTAMKTGSTAIQAASRIVQNAVKRVDLAVRNAIFPAEESLRKLSKAEITDLADIFKEESTRGTRFSTDTLVKNLSVKQLEAYTHMREMFDKSLDAQNDARLSKGQKPVTPQEAYMASRWEGDFRRPIRDAKGNTVWYLASNTKMGLEAQTKALLKKMPDLVVDRALDHTTKSGSSKSDLQSMYTTMLDILGRDDPAVQRIKEAVEAATMTEAATTRSQEQHFKHKGGVRGFVGDRPGLSNPAKEAIAMFQQQIQYAKNAFTWSEMQKAADDIKPIITDPVLRQEQPNNVKYIREYFKNAMGHGESQVTRQISDSLREGLGVSPKIINEAVGDIKSFFILQKLAMSAGFTLANVVQTTNVLPYLTDLYTQGYKGNPVKALTMGVSAGPIMMVSHYLKAAGGEYINKLPNQFLKDAIRYAEDNGVTARSVYDESPIQSSFNPVANAANIASKTMTVPETFVRSVAFMTYAQMLKDSGKFTNMSKLFQKAEEMVNKSMVDYRETEKPMIFSKAGAAGNFLNTLQTYPMSFYNQYSYMAGQAAKGNPLPLLTMAGLHGLMAGAAGIPYTEDMYQMYKWIKDNMLSTGTWAETQKSPLLSDPKLWVLENLGQGALYGALSDQTGLGLSSRISAPSVGNMLQSPVGPIMDVGKQVGNVVSAVADPTNSTKWAQVGMSSSPVGLQGLLETSGVMKDHTYVTRPDGSKVFMKTTDLAKREGSVTRTPEEETIRKFGLRSQREIVEKDVNYLVNANNTVARKKSGELMDKLYDASRRGDTDQVAKLAQLYTQLTGKEITDDMIGKQVMGEYMTSLEKTKVKAGLTPQELLNIGRMKNILEKQP